MITKPHTGVGLGRLPSQWSRDSPDMGLSINSMSTMATPPLGQRRMLSQPGVAQVASRARPLASRSTGFNGYGDAGSKTLPPLQCTGQGRNESRSPSNDDMEARMISKLRGVRTGSPFREYKGDKNPHERALFNKDPLLKIGSMGPTGAPPPSSGLLPPDMHRMQVVAKVAARPATHTGVARMARHGGAVSMPHLGPPRLLVQSVGAAY
jgi:hypothetical protein